MTKNASRPASKTENVHQSDTSRLTLHQRAPVKVLTDGKEAEGVRNDFPVGADHRDHRCHLGGVATPAIPCPICDSPKLETEGKTHDTRFVRCEACGFELHHCGPNARVLAMNAALKAVHARQTLEAENRILRGQLAAVLGPKREVA
ncbi:hypothetical protein [Marinobacter segnicrescens]|uniref:hypothetical protein n=1 Tax=Marinobacter segnicrescens TaxID=430453 RepID=UPI003A8F8B15